MDKLLKELCYRLPYGLKGRLESEEIDVELVGISFKDPSHPIIEVSVPNFKAPWTITPDLFKPYLKPLFPTIYEEQPGGKVPWLEYQKRWYDEGLIGTGKTGSEFLKNLTRWEFRKPGGERDKWWYFDGKIMVDGKESSIFETATFYHHLAYQVAYEMGIDVEGLIEEGKALLWTP